MLLINIFINVIYPVMWILTVFWPPLKPFTEILSMLLIIFLMVLHFVYSQGEWLKKGISTLFHEDPIIAKNCRLNLVTTSIVVYGSAILITQGIPYLSSVLTIAMAGLGSLYLGMSFGFLAFRQFNHYSKNLPPTPIMNLYETSLNANLAKTHSPMLFVIIPSGIYGAILGFGDYRVLVCIVPFLADNLRWRLYTIVPVALYLLTEYELSLPFWRKMKQAVRKRFPIASLILDKEGVVPKEYWINQDLVRVKNDQDWFSAVRLIAKYVPLIIIDTHSYSSSVDQELELFRYPELSSKIVIVDRPNMNPHMRSRIIELINNNVEVRLLTIEEICNRLRALHDDWMQT